MSIKNASVRALTWAVFPVITAACTLTPDAQLLPLIEDVRGLDTFQVDAALFGEGRDLSQWWVRFGHIELAGLVDQLVNNSLTLVEARAQVEIAEEVWLINRSQRQPSLTLNSGYAATERILPAGNSDVSGLFDFDLSAFFDADVFGALRSADRASRLNFEAARVSYLAIEQQEIARVATNWVAAITLQRRLDLARSISESFGSTYDLTDKRYRAGSTGTSANDVQIALQNYESALVDIPDLEAQLRIQLFAIDSQLARLPGTTQETFIGEINFDAITLAPIGMPAELISMRPDVAAAELRYLAALEDIGAARANLYPSLGLSASLSFSGDDPINAFDWNAHLARLAANLSQPLFQGGRLKAQLRLEESEAQELAAAFARQTLDALIDVEAALTDLKGLSEQRALQIRAVETAELSNQLAQSRYRRGLSSILSVLETQRSLNNAQLALILIEQALLNAQINLYLSLGGSWFEDPDPDTQASTDPSET